MKKQNCIFPKSKLTFGGLKDLGKRKAQRPLSPKSPIHLILKSSKAKGKNNFVAHQRRLLKVLQSQSKKFGIRIFDQAIVWNHIHMVIQIPNRENYNRFIRALTSIIVSIVGTEKGFFDHLPFTRLAHWGRDFKNLLEYLVLNHLEVRGLRPRKGQDHRKAKRSFSIT